MKNHLIVNGKDFGEVKGLEIEIKKNGKRAFHFELELGIFTPPLSESMTTVEDCEEGYKVTIDWDAEP